MKNRYLVFLIIIFCCSGCHADYSLNIDKVDSIVEDVALNATTDMDRSRFKDYKSYLPITYGMDDISAFQKRLDGVEYYHLSKKDDNMSFHYDKFNVKKLNQDMFARSCYKYVTVMEQKKSSELLLSTSKEFLCFERYDTLEDVTVSITSKYKLKDTNADEVNGHTYRWFITKGNADNKYLYLLLDTTVRELTLWDRIMEGEFTNTFTIFLAIALIGGFILFLLKKKGDRKNKI